mgnify:CR=1 FL=1
MKASTKNKTQNIYQENRSLFHSQNISYLQDPDVVFQIVMILSTLYYTALYRLSTSIYLLFNFYRPQLLILL